MRDNFIKSKSKFTNVKNHAIYNKDPVFKPCLQLVTLDLICKKRNETTSYACSKQNVKRALKNM